MAETEPAYSKSQYIMDNRIGTLAVYHMRPGGMELNHAHHGVELVYVLEGDCLTHKKGHLYMYKKGEVHEVMNNSQEELVFVCLSIPQDTLANTVYV